MFMPTSYFLYMLGTPFLKAMGLLYWGTLTQGFPSNPVETVTAALQSEALSVQSCFLPALLSQVSALCHSLKLSLPALLLPPYSSQAFHSTNLLHIWSQSICVSAQTDTRGHCCNPSKRWWYSQIRWCQRRWSAVVRFCINLKVETVGFPDGLIVYWCEQKQRVKDESRVLA